MIRVKLAQEPATFDKCVRQPGLRAIAEMVGESPPRKAGRRHRKVADERDQIPADKYPPYWRKALPDLLTRYDRICAYLCLYISQGTGAKSVDHFVPKSQQWDCVYEWRNYRLACSQINSKKHIAMEVLDPFEIGDDWFALELVEFQVIAGGTLSDNEADAVSETIHRLRLNKLEYCKARLEYAQSYWDKDISWCYLCRHSPFVARELRRQGRL